MDGYTAVHRAFCFPSGYGRESFDAEGEMAPRRGRFSPQQYSTPAFLMPMPDRTYTLQKVEHVAEEFSGLLLGCSVSWACPSWSSSLWPARVCILEASPAVAPTDFNSDARGKA